MVQSSSSSVEEKPRIKMCTFKLESAMLKNRVPTSYTVHERNGAQESQDGNMGTSMLAHLSNHLTNVQEGYGGTLEIEGLITGWAGW